MSQALISSSRVEGTDVYNQDQEKLGKIDSVMIDKVTGQSRFAVLSFGGFLGIGSDLYPVPWSVLRYDTTLEGYVIPMSKDQLEAAPRYSQDGAPEYTERYGRSVFDHYGIGLY